MIEKQEHGWGVVFHNDESRRCVSFQKMRQTAGAFAIEFFTYRTVDYIRNGVVTASNVRMIYDLIASTSEIFDERARQSLDEIAEEWCNAGTIRGNPITGSPA